jgi:hypothetical protein
MEISMPSAAEENNKTIFIRAIGNWNKGNLSEYSQLYDPSVVLHGYMGVVESSLERVKKFYQRFWAAFPLIVMGSTWMKLHPNYIETIPTNHRDLLSDITPDAFMQQFNVVLNWYASNWSGV